jgi:hypothetical protein
MSHCCNAAQARGIGFPSDQWPRPLWRFSDSVSSVGAPFVAECKPRQKRILIFGSNMSYCCWHVRS